MAKSVRLLILSNILLLFFSSGLFATKKSSFEGVHFMIAFMQNEISIDNSAETKIYVTTAATAANFTISYPGTTQQYSIYKNQVIEIQFDPNYFQTSTSEIVSYYVAELTSDSPVTVYAFNSQQQTSDSYSIIPIAYWGTQYVAMAMPNDQYNAGSDPSLVYPRRGEFLFIASEDGTDITFSPRVPTAAGKLPGKFYKVTLNKGQCYQVQSMDGPRGSYDLTGTIVNSNKPIGFLSGHVRASVILNGHDSKNHLAEMLLPTDAWGNAYISVPFNVNTWGDFFKITTIKDSTTISLQTDNGTLDTTFVKAGSFAEFAYINSAAVWRANKPFQICQFMMQGPGSLFSTSFDPCMVNLPAIGQFIQSVTYTTPDNPSASGISNHYVSIVATAEAVSNLRMDGSLISLSTKLSSQNIFGNGYYFVTMSSPFGTHTISCDTGQFSCIMFGKGNYDAYAMNIGSSLNNPFKKDTIAPKFACSVNCGDLSITISETLDSINSGINYVNVYQDSTFNYSYNITNLTDFTNVVNVSASPTDKTKPAKIVIGYSDKNGNGSRYSYTYNPPGMTIIDNYDYGYVRGKDTACTIIYVYNKGKDSVKFNAMSLDSDSRLTAKSTTLPKWISPGDSIPVTLCFIPNFTSNSFSYNLNLMFDCNITKVVNIKGRVLNPQIMTLGHDFGKCRIGDTICSYVKFYNTGNSVITITSVQFPQPSQFYYDTTGLFPIKFNPGDSLYILACFSAQTLNPSSNSIKFINSEGLDATADVKGIGTAPKISSVMYDWDRQRIGTTNVKTLYLKNSGTCTGKITLINKIVRDSAAFNDSQFIDSVFTILQNDSVGIQCAFLPQDTVIYNYFANYLVDWKFHDTVSIKFSGLGTVPVIKTKDVIFDTTGIMRTTNLQKRLVYSTGNEKLTIDSAYYFAGDSSAFTVDYSVFKNKVVPFYDSLLVPVGFVPKTIGAHEMIIALVSDPNPAFNRSLSYIKLRGFCIPLDTPRIEFQILPPNELISCSDSTIKIILKNTGNVDLVLDSAIESGTNVKITKSELAAPKKLTISPRQNYEYSVSFISEKGKQSSYRARLVFNDSIICNILYTAYPRTLKLTIDPVPIFDVKPNTSFTLNLHGSIPIETYIKTGFSLELRLDATNFILSSLDTNIIFEGKNKLFVPAKLKQTFDHITITPSISDYLFEPSTKWSIDLRFATMLGFDHNPTINTILNSENCFIADTELIKTNLIPICAFDIRGVQINSTFTDIYVTPNPVEDRFTANIVMPYDSPVNLEIYDVNARKIDLLTNFYLKRGTYSLNFENSILTDGIYLLNLQTDLEMKKTLLIIIKK
ncbi:MAG: hypothetical protein NT007_15260 [Candidatus Kapabacteria bacterium]|nr:hypothetical protein [Candidatus Kapabacteria bacterium]